MSTHDPRDAVPIADPRVDAAWRELSGETPPASLDAAIMAAARREVGAGPQRIGAREALADRRRWWPLAAAATVAAIAIGVLQLTPPDQFGAPIAENSVVSDLPAPAMRPAPEMPATLPRKEEEMADSSNDLRSERESKRADAPQRKMAPTEARERKKDESASGNSPAMAEPFPGAPRQSAVTAAATPAPSAPAPAPSPPAPPAPATPASMAFAPAVPATPSPLPAAPHPVAPASADPSVATSPVAAPAAAARASAAPAPAGQLAAKAEAARATESAAARPAPLAKVAAGRAADALATESQIKDRAPLPVADWIALIRRLRDEGKSAVAEKELVAFRAAHADHAKLLPPDLRDWRPPAK